MAPTDWRLMCELNNRITYWPKAQRTAIPIYTYVTVNSELTQNKLQSNIYQEPSR